MGRRSIGTERRVRKCHHGPTTHFTETGSGVLISGDGKVMTAGDASSPVTDAKVNVHAGLLAYARSLDVWGLSGKVFAVLPFTEASGSEKVAGQGRDRRVFGLADLLLRISVNFFGAPALSWRTSRRTGRTSSSGPACR